MVNAATGAAGGLEQTGPANSTETFIEEFKYNDSIVRMFTVATILWGVVAFLAGLFIAIQLVIPWLRELLNMPTAFRSLDQPFLSFGRIRPLHTNAAIFAFAGNAVFAAVYYSTQRLCKARMWSDIAGIVHFWGWQAIIVCAALTLPLGITQSKEYAELEWPIDILIAVVWVIFGLNFVMTLVKRRERHMYVALWFYIATIVTVAVLHIFNNLVIPVEFLKSYPIYAGVQDAFMQWWYGHNAVAFFLTTPFLGLMYYFLPKAADRPVFSYKLSIIHFWSLVFIYIWAGPHHLHYTALPDWASTLGMLFSVMLWMPSWGGMINGLLTLRGAWSKVAADPVLKFFVVGITFYGMSTFEGPLLSVKSINALSHYTDWTIAHVHGGALGWNGFMTFGMIYWLLPRLYQTKLYSVKLATWHFWLGTIGILLYILPIYVAGLTQGLMWRALTETGQLMHPDFLETVRALMPLYAIRVVAGLLFIVGMLLMVYNFAMTWRSAPVKYEEPIVRAPRLAPTYVDEPLPRSQLVAVLESGKRIDELAMMAWHRRWERFPIKFTVFVVISVVVASLFEVIPTFLIRANIATVPKDSPIKPYTPLELAGRDIYISEGCYNCHSQMIRPLVAETMRYGEYSKPQEFVYDHPFQWGSRRIGPDLAREGGRQSSIWHYQHLLAPDVSVVGSIMPPYVHLFSKDNLLNFNGIPPRVRAAYLLGAPYGEELDNSIELAKAQARKIAVDITTAGGPIGLDETKGVALIAYLQRLGTDLFRTPAPAPTSTPEAPKTTDTPKTTAAIESTDERPSARQIVTTDLAESKNKLPVSSVTDSQTASVSNKVTSQQHAVTSKLPAIIYTPVGGMP